MDLVMAGAMGIEVVPRSTDIFIGIDGTGDSDGDVYDAEFTNLGPDSIVDAKFAKSFVRQLFDVFSTSNPGNGRWYEGPNWANTAITSNRVVNEAAGDARDFIKYRWDAMTWPVEKAFRKTGLPRVKGIPSYGGPFGAVPASMLSGIGPTPGKAVPVLSPADTAILASNKQPRVFLSGWSRGGAGAIVVANLLKAFGIPVHAMLLFDAVRMSVSTLGVGEIPDNVRYCFHAMRNPATHSRASWGNCGTRPADRSKTGFVKELFFCTHAGMGGQPWKVSVPQNNAILKKNDPVPAALISYDEAGGLAAFADNLPSLEAQVAKRRASPDQQFISETPSDSPLPTNVTVAQDAEVSAKVGLWMGRGFNFAAGQEPMPYISIIR